MEQNREYVQLMRYPRKNPKGAVSSYLSRYISFFSSTDARIPPELEISHHSLRSHRIRVLHTESGEPIASYESSLVNVVSV